MSEEPRDLIEPSELIERALGKYLERAMDAGDETHGQHHSHKWLKRDYHKGQIIDALSEYAVVVQCEVQHVLPGVDPLACPNGYTIIDGQFNMPYGPQPYGEFRYEREGIHGKEGKAVAIILSLEG